MIAKRIWGAAIALLLLTAAVAWGSDRARGEEAAPTASQFIQTRMAPATVAKVIDGDTIDVELDGELVRIRFMGIDTGETTLCKRRKVASCAHCKAEQLSGLEAKAFVNDVIPRGSAVLIVPQGVDKYRRLLAYVFARVDGKTVDLGKEMIRRGLAAVYTGGRKTKPWCR